MAQQDPVSIIDARRRIAWLESQDGLAAVQQALCDPARLRIVVALGGGAELSVGELAAAVGRKVPATSQHLRVLRDLGVVEGERLGTAIYYRLKAGKPAHQIQVILAALRDERAVAS